MAAALELSISQKLFENPIIVTDQPMAPNNILPDLQLSFGASKTKNRQGHSFPFVPFKFGKENVLYSSNLVPLSQDMIPNHVWQTALHYCTVTRCNKAHGVEHQENLI